MAEQQTPKYYCDFCRNKHGVWPKPLTADALHAHIKIEHPYVFFSAVRAAADAALQTTGGKP